MPGSASCTTMARRQCPTETSLEPRPGAGDPALAATQGVVEQRPDAGDPALAAAQGVAGIAAQILIVYYNDT